MSKFESSAVTWFEIPTTDIDRAARFYEDILGVGLRSLPSGEPGRYFPAQESGVAGCLVQRPHQKPLADGTLVYLNADGRLNTALERAQAAGSQVLVPRTQVPGIGAFYAVITDSEGNHVGLHSRGE